MKHEGKLEGRHWVPRGTRIGANYDVQVQSDEAEVDAEVLNLSSEGFRLRARTPLKAGAVVMLVAEGEEPVKALICWAVGLEAGGVFAEPAAL